MPESPFTDLARPPLREAGLRRALVRPDEPWTALTVTPDTGSTNADLVAAARDGAPSGTVLVAEHQTAAQGRLGRTWTSPARAGLALSVLLRPGEAEHGWPALPLTRYAWLPLLAGVALAETVTRLCRVPVGLKWPNDLLVTEPDGRTGKCAGILAEAVPTPSAPPAVVLGIGLNVTLHRDELPRPDATSLALADAACTDRDPLLRGLLRALADHYHRFRTATGDPDTAGLRPTYRATCRTLDTPVRVTLPDNTALTGTATDIDTDGRLVVTTPDGTRKPVAAGDVTHVRPDSS